MAKPPSLKVQVALLALVCLALIVFAALAVFFDFGPLPYISHQIDDQKQQHAETIGAAIADFTQKNDGQYPWNITSAAYDQGPAQPAASFNSDDKGLAWIKELEIPASLAPAIIKGNDLHIYKDIGSPTNVYVCFKPQSKDQREEAALACQNGKAPRIPNTPVCETNSPLLCLSFEIVNAPAELLDSEEAFPALPAPGIVEY